MTNEEIQRTMEFVLNQQARFSEGMEQLRESHAQAEKRIGNLETAFVGLTSIVTDIGKAQQALTERVTQLAADIAELREAQAHTDQRVNALIDIIERWRNGESKS
ncbi:MAG TPA: hypothetical protein VE360_10975 [Pyrinomonadaceae bacterium]|jgi:chromosome segregation ATPase|nr:hypothetical protein [Pyrinomonadaceae bacterium]